MTGTAHTTSDSDASLPTYEQALQHRRIEGHVYSNNPVFPPDGAYPGPPRIRRPRPQSSRSRRFQLPSTNFSRSVTPVVVTEDDAISRASSLDLRSQACMKLALPPMHMCMAITCLILNIIAPGVGTMLSGFGIFCCTKSEDWTVKEKFTGFGYSLLVGLGQLVLTAVLLLGWIWSIMWGFALLGVSLDTYHGPKDDDEEDSPESTSEDPVRHMVGHSMSTQTQSSACSSDGEVDVETGARAADTGNESGESTVRSLPCASTCHEVAQVHRPRGTGEEFTEEVPAASYDENDSDVASVVSVSNLPPDPPPYEVAAQLTSVTT